MYWRRVNGRKPWVLNVSMQSSNDCVMLIVRSLKKLGITHNKVYEKKRMIMESEVT